jgi:hypothetical protein
MALATVVSIFSQTHPVTLAVVLHSLLYCTHCTIRRKLAIRRLHTKQFDDVPFYPLKIFYS